MPSMTRECPVILLRAFDARGVFLDLPIIREGVVGALYQDTELARELNSRPSGHEGPDGCWPGNLVLRAGTRSRNMIFPELGPFLLLDDLNVSGRWFDLQTGKLRLKGHFFAGTSAEDLQYVGYVISPPPSLILVGHSQGGERPAALRGHRRQHGSWTD